MRECEFSGCLAESKSRGLCMFHYNAAKRAGQFGERPICSVDGCGRKVSSSGMCCTHRRRVLQGKPLNAPIRGARKPCSVDGCDRPSEAMGLCVTHRIRQRRGKPLEPPIRSNEAGSREGQINDYGYRITYAPDHPNAMSNGYMLEHRLVVAQLIGRALVEHENVHHLNGDRLDNRAWLSDDGKICGNLELWNTKQPKGQRIEDKLEYAREIITLYAPLQEPDDAHYW